MTPLLILASGLTLTCPCGCSILPQAYITTYAGDSALSGLMFDLRCLSCHSVVIRIELPNLPT